MNWFLWLKSFHIIAMVAWFAGLFYLPRLFVYHAETRDSVGQQRFELMEKKLYYQIMWPAAVLTTVLGVGLLSLNYPAYLKAGWFHFKLTLVAILWIYHLSCGYFRKLFVQHKQKQPARFFRIFNEIPTVLLMFIVFLAVIKPF